MKKLQSANVKMAVPKAFGIAGAVVLVYGGFAGLFGERAVPTASAQSDQFLSRRIDQIENRFYGLESQLNRLETASRPSITLPSSPRGTTVEEQEISYLRSQLDALRTRLGEAECGLLRLDERTLSPAARTARTKSASGNPEPCRREPSSPVSLSARP